MISQSAYEFHIAAPLTEGNVEVIVMISPKKSAYEYHITDTYTRKKTIASGQVLRSEVYKIMGMHGAY